ncbi:hypothetical protein BRC66_04580 [Halobacteriales archaeon QH_2_66_30]|nr:MAG: hypothetical protein BRC66_04580 [Halobacteriales archaeon QH_2_66_30]
MESTGGRITQFLLICLVFSVLGVAFVGVSLAQGAGGDNGTVVWQTDSQQVQDGAAPEMEIDADDITMSAQIYENGTATLEIDYQIRLDSDADRQAFEEIQSELASNESAYLGPFRERMNRTVAAAESATEREMTASGFAVSTDRDSQLQAEFGHVRYRFEWGGFAVVDDGTIRAGDAVDSLFLDDSESLVFQWPDGYGVASSEPDPERVENNSIVWQGQIDFEAGQPRVVLSTDADDGAGDGGSDPEDLSGDGDGGTDDGGTDDGGTDDGGADDGGSSSMSVMPMLGIVGLVLVAGAGVAVLVTNRGEDDSSEGRAATDPADTPPEDLLSNEERVLQLLQENGGRVKQKQVAEQLDWTAAKTSQVVGDLRDDDEVDSFRLGRENVLTLPDVDIEGSADDDSTGGGESDAESNA